MGGVINLPAIVGGNHWLETWLHPALERASTLMPVALPPHAAELALVGVASLVAVGPYISATAQSALGKLLAAISPEATAG